MYIKWLPNGEWTEYTLAQLRRDNPNVSFPKIIPADVLDTYSVYQYVEAAKPDFNPLTQYLVPNLVDAGQYWEKQWTIVDKNISTSKQNLIAQVASDRWNKESTGIVWTDASGDRWLIDTTIDSQNRLASVSISIEKGIRVENGVWKCFQVIDDNGEDKYSLSFRPTTNDELQIIAQLVHDHVQKCFQAEANAVAKINDDDLTATFEEEFNQL
jgi:hypothetical protein